MTEEATNWPSNTELMQMTADVVAAYVANNPVDQNDVPQVIRSVFSSLSELGSEDLAAALNKSKPAVPIARSITPDYVVCLEDGKKFKMLKRHLRKTYGLTPEAYRAKWRLPSDYPMVAPNYSKVRSAHAKKIGLGK